jgi:acetyltransferase-like isoleucine patch superfamily enzyme
MFVRLYYYWGRVRDRIFTLLCRFSFAGFGPESLLCLPIRVEGERWIEIGRKVHIGPNCWFNVLRAADDGSPRVSIGDETAIVGSCTITAVERVTIERRVLMAGNVYISDHTHNYDSRTVAIKDQGVTQGLPIRICEGAWLGQNVVICPGVTIGRNAVVGANSVVKIDVPDFSVAVGAPAKVIRQIDEQSPRPVELLKSVSRSA